jgi:hypothetical protein
MKRKTDSPAALDHVLYEMEMLTMAVVELSRTGRPQYVDSAWLEV